MQNLRVKNNLTPKFRAMKSMSFTPLGRGLGLRLTLTLSLIDSKVPNAMRLCKYFQLLESAIRVSSLGDTSQIFGCALSPFLWVQLYPQKFAPMGAKR